MSNTFFTNYVSGMPSGHDFYSSGSELTVKNIIQTPEGFNSSAFSAIINPHQNRTDTKPIGVPGTNYSSHPSDQIFRSEAGHFILFGNNPEHPTLRVQSASGAAIELDEHGAMKMVSGKGLHMSIGSDHHIVINGDFSIATSGDFKIKAGNVFFDCNDFNIHATGNYIKNVDGDSNDRVYGDDHSFVNGDKSISIAGDFREITAGSFNSQASQAWSMSCGTTATFGAVKSMNINSKALMNLSAQGNTTIQTQASLSTTSMQAMNISSNDKINQTSKSDMTISSQAQAFLNSQNNLDISSQADVNIKANGNAYIGGKKSVGITGTNLVQIYSASILTTPTPVSGASVTGSGPISPINANNSVANVAVIVPDNLHIMDYISDHVASNNTLTKIYNTDQLYENYGSDDSGNATSGTTAGNIPPLIMQRAKQMGIIDQNFDNIPNEDLAADDFNNNSDSYGNAGFINQKNDFHPGG